MTEEYGHVSDAFSMLPKEELLMTESLSKGLTINFRPECSDWKCYMFGNRPDGKGIIYTPAEGQVPNCFVRFMMRICFDCFWVKNK
jgi:hypothetical protein